MWYSYLSKYHDIYMAIDDGIEYYFDKHGNYLTQSYKSASPENSTFIKWYNKPIELIKSETNRIIGYLEYTCSVEFTTNGLIYCIATNKYNIISDNVRLTDIPDFQYIFVPYENE